MTIFLQWKHISFFQAIGDDKPRDKNHCFHMGWQSRKEGRKDATHIRSDQPALIRLQHGDNLGRSWCACVRACALLRTQMEDSVARGKSWLVCVCSFTLTQT
jgi:hypothetical protein